MSMHTQLFEYYIVLDFEATCDSGKRPVPQEIIEYPSVLISANTFEVVNEFRSFVCPQHHPVLTPFCLEFTGITQQQVENAPLFQSVLANHLAWLRQNNLRVSPDDFGSRFAFILCGDWDLMTMFPSQCRACEPSIDYIPFAFRQWVNIKKHFARHKGVAKAPGMAGMLRDLGLELIGHHHCGIDDCRNIAQIARHLGNREVALSITTELPVSRYPPVRLLLRNGVVGKKVTLERRSMKALLGLGSGSFKQKFTRAIHKEGPELMGDKDLRELTNDTEILLM